MPFYERDNVRIHYEEAGSGFPLLVMPGGGLSSHLGRWPTAVFNAMEAFKNDFRVITMDQRNAIGGQSTGPVQVDDPWGAFADDQIGLMDHLGINEFMALGCCIGGPFVLKIAERVPGRVQAVVMCQPVGRNEAHPDAMYDAGHNTWGPELCQTRPDLNMEHIDRYLHNLYRNPDDFVYSVTRDFVRSCQTPILVMPDDTPAHSYEVAIEVTQLAPNCEVTLYPWKETPETKVQAVDHVMRFLKAHEPVTANR
jgi:pimeloyl-ACP methyl ester carboxylesterase